MFVVVHVQRFLNVSLKTSHLLAVKRIFRYLKGKPSLGLWYSKDSPLELVAYTDSDYAGATQDRKSTTGGCSLDTKLTAGLWDKTISVILVTPNDALFEGRNVVCSSSVGFNTTQQMVISSPCLIDIKNWLVQSKRLLARLEFCDKHNMAAFLDKSTGSEGFHQVIDFLSQSHISYALTKKPEIYISFIKQFWRTAEASTDTDGEVTITAIIDGQSKAITEASLRSLKITSSPSLSSEPSTEPTFEPQPSPDAEYHVPTPNESPLHAVHSHGSDEGSLKLIELTNLVTKLSERIGVLEDDLKKTKQTYSSAFTKLILRIKKLESKVKTGKARKGARIVLLEDEEDDSSKQGRIDEDLNTYFAQDDEVVHDQDIIAKEVTRNSTRVFTVSNWPLINLVLARETHSTADRVVYGRRNKETRKDKGKANQSQIARDEEIARQLLALDEERVTTETKTTKDIDWNDPSVQKYWDKKNKPKSEAQARKNMIVYLKNQSNYKMKDFEGMSYDEIRPIFEKIWDFNHNFVPMDLEIDKEKKKPAESQEIEIEQIKKDTTGKRKKSLPRKRTRSSTKKQKVELDDEKEDLKGYLDIVPREDVAVDVDFLSTKYPIVDWKTYTLSENFMYYKIIRGDGSSKNYKILSEMLYDFDRQDVVELYRLVKERYSSLKTRRI
ncbi:hypothetical protein Tco_0878909 [Tanacetum coccineum]|uniref:Uncharacterized protein n=1 Tax=Tanacetum coccineum TaxID=301880 RepID=A0ABQ5C2E1_9ASTR